MQYSNLIQFGIAYEKLEFQNIGKPRLKKETSICFGKKRARSVLLIF